MRNNFFFKIKNFQQFYPLVDFKTELIKLKL